MSADRKIKEHLDKLDVDRYEYAGTSGVFKALRALLKEFPAERDCLSTQCNRAECRLRRVIAERIGVDLD